MKFKQFQPKIRGIHSQLGLSRQWFKRDFEFLALYAPKFTNTKKYPFHGGLESSTCHADQIQHFVKNWVRVGIVNRSGKPISHSLKLYNVFETGTKNIIANFQFPVLVTYIVQFKDLF